VLAVLTHQNMPRMNALPWSHLRPQGQTYLPFQDDKIHYAGQPIAIVVAETRSLRSNDLTRVRAVLAGRPMRRADGQAAAVGAVARVLAVGVPRMLRARQR
jgi:hypothetical protein